MSSLRVTPRRRSASTTHFDSTPSSHRFVGFASALLFVLLAAGGALASPCAPDHGPPCALLGPTIPAHLFVFTDGSANAAWQGPAKGYAGDVVVSQVAGKATAGFVPYAGVIATDAASLGPWDPIVFNNAAQAGSLPNQIALLNDVKAELVAAFHAINALPATSGFTNVTSTSLNLLSTKNGIAEQLVINVTSGFDVTEPISISGDNNDLFVLRWDANANPADGYQGTVKFSSGGGIVPKGDLTAANFIHVAGNLASGAGGNSPPAPYPQGPRVANGAGELIIAGSNWSGGGFFTGYWLTTGAPETPGPNNLWIGATTPLSHANFVGGWYTLSTNVSLADQSGGVHVAWVAGPRPSLGIVTLTNDLDNNVAPLLVPVGAPLTWTYVVTNSGGVMLSNIEVTSSNGPVCTVPSLAPGASSTCTATGVAQAGIHLNTGSAIATVGDVVVAAEDPDYYDGSSYAYLPCPAGMFTYSVDDTGLHITYDQFPAPNDNSYGVNAVGWPGGHKFGDLVGSDKAGFQIVDPNGIIRLSFNIDYLTATTGTPSGYASRGPFGGDGGIVTGTLTPADISWDTSLARNLNNLGYFTGGVQTVGMSVANLLVDSPPTLNKVDSYVLTDAAAAAFTNGWDFHDTYFVTLSVAKLQAIGFLDANGNPVSGWKVEPNPSALHNSPDKDCPPAAPICGVSVTAYNVSTTQVQVTLKNDATTNAILTELHLRWPAANGCLKQIKLDGDVLYNVATCGTSLDLTTAPPLPTDPNKRKIDKGTSDVLYLIFEKAAQPLGPGYGGLAIFDASCPVTLFPYPAIDLVKKTNGTDNDSPTGPYLQIGSTVTWTYQVTNVGNVMLSNVVVIDDNGTPLTTADDITICTLPSLVAGATTTCTATGIAQPGQYANIAKATGEYEDQTVSDTNPDHYFGSSPAIRIIKKTNGTDNDLPTGPYVPVGSTVTWTYDVTNSGNVPLTGVVVTDDMGVAVTCPKTILAVGESMRCSASGIAVAGQYANIATAKGTPPSGPDVTDTNPDHYFGSNAKITIVKKTNGTDNDMPPGLYVVAGSQVTWTYEVTNNGNVKLDPVTVTDDHGVAVSCPKTSLEIGESMTCSATGIAIAGQYTNVGTATGKPPVGPDVNAENPDNYFGSQPAVTIVKKTNGSDNDAAPGLYLLVGDPVTWSYEVTNSGNVALDAVTVTDNQGVTVTCPQTTLAVGESMTCTATGTAQLGQYTNVGCVLAEPPVGNPVDACNPDNYFGSQPSIRVIKYTNGDDADVPTGPFIPVGAPVMWTYVVTNTGNVKLTAVALTDDILGAISCPKSELTAGESMTCTANGVAMAGQYANLATVTGTPPVGPPVTDDNPSHYFGSAPGVTIVKLTNGSDNDQTPGPYLLVGDPVTWTYRVSNSGNVTLTNISVTDDKGVPVTCPKTTLLAGESMTCTATGVAQLGQYTNVGCVLAQPPAGNPVDACNPDNYFGSQPSIDIVKKTNGSDNDMPPGPYIPVGDPVTWTYEVTNTGNVALTNVAVTDDQGVKVDCPKTTLAVGESMTCSATGVAVLGQYTNVGSVTGTPPAGPNVTDDNPDNYYGSAPEITIVKTTNGSDNDTAPGLYVLVGDPVTWTYVVTNSGNVELTGIALTDDQFGLVTCPKTTLAAGESMTCTATGVAQLGQYTNIGCVLATPPAGPQVDACNPDNYFGSQPAITIVKKTNATDNDAAPGIYVPTGSPVTWTYEVKNTGNVVLDPVIVTDDMGVVVTCPKTALAAGESMICTASGIAIEGQYSNIGTANGKPPVGPDVNATNPDNYFGSNPSIDIVKLTNGTNNDTAPGPLVPVGSTVTWTYNVTNTGNVQLTNIVVTDDKGATVTCPKTTLAVGESMTCTASGIAVAGQYTNIGTTTGTPPVGPPVTDQNPDNYFGSNPSITIVKKTNNTDNDSPPGIYVQPGSAVLWTYAVTNTGNVALDPVIVTDDHGVSVTCPKTKLAIGESMMCVAAGLAVSGQYTNIGTATGTPPVGPPVTDDNPDNYFGSSPAIEIVKLTNGTNNDVPTGPYVPVGSTVTWTYQVKNVGNVELTNISVTDNQGVAVTCPQTTLAAGESMTCTATGIAIAGQYTNIGATTGTPPVGPPVTDDNPDNYFGATPSIDIVKLTNGSDNDSAPGPLVPVGSTVTWTYKVTNTGNVALTNVTVSDDHGVAVSCPKTTLAVGESMSCTANGIAVAGQYTNIGTTTGTPPVGPPVTDQNPDNYFGSNPSIDIVKLTNDTDNDSAPGINVPAGSTVTWTYDVTNTGNVELTNVAVTDDKGVAVSCPKTTLAIGESMMCTASGTAIAGQYTNIGTATGTPPVGPPVSDQNPDNYFGQTSAIGDFVWLDANGNGVQDAGEPGIAGAIVKLVDCNGNVLDTYTTAANGFYQFTDLNPGSYSVVFVLPAGYVFTTPDLGNDALDSDANIANGAAICYTLGPGETNTTIDAGAYIPVSIGDYVWEDLNGNGVQNSGEPGIAGVTLNLTGTTGSGAAVSRATTTDGNGGYLFGGLPPGTYSVAVVTPAGYVATVTGMGTAATDSNPSPSGTTPMALPSGSSDVTLDFGFYKPAAIGDYVWIDANVNGQQDAGEAPLPGVNAVLSGTTGAGLPVTMTTSTDANGLYAFTGLAPGSYNVAFTASPGYVLTAANNGNDASDSDAIPTGANSGTTGSYTLVSGQTNNTVDAGFYGGVAIGDFVWNDLDGNGVQDNGEPGIAGVTLHLNGTDGLGNAVSQTTMTDTNGAYLFDGLVPGTYSVSVDTPAGYVPTVTGQGSSAIDSNVSPSGTTPLTLPSGGSDLTLDFGFYQPVSIGDYVWDDLNGNGVQNNGEPGIGGVTLNLTGTDGVGNPVSLTTATDASGAYLFNGLPPGTYSVAVVTPAGYVPTVAGMGTAATDSNPSPSGTTPLMLPGGGSDLTLDFGFYKPAAIGDYAWVDINANGQQDGEPPLPGVTVTLIGTTGAGAPVNLTTTTDASGLYHFTGLAPGAYAVTFNGLPGFALTMPNVGGDATDSDAIPSAPSSPVGTTGSYTLISGQTDDTVDAGFVPLQAAIDLVKLTNGTDNNAAPGVKLQPGDPVTWTYNVINTGQVMLAPVVITDDNGTPASIADDFIVCTIASLAPGATQSCTFSGTAIIGQYTNIATAVGTPPIGTPVSDSDPDNYNAMIPCPAGSFTWSMDASGNLNIVYEQFPAPNDNSYGVNAVGWPGGHTFGNLTGSDKAGFQLIDPSGVVRLSFNIDYLSAATGTPSGYKSLGPFGGDGAVVVGPLTAADLTWDTSLARNLNNLGYFTGGVQTVGLPVANLLVNSPPTLQTMQDYYTANNFAAAYTLTDAANAAFTNGWDFVNAYFVTVNASKLASLGFNPATWQVVPNASALHNSPDKDCPPAPGGCSVKTTKWEVKDNQLKITLFNTSTTTNAVLTDLTVSWPAMNGALKQIKLDGDVIYNVPVYGTSVTLTAADMVADPNKRTITKNSSDQLIFVFEKKPLDPAITDPLKYSGSVAFDSSCSFAILPKP